MVYVTCPNNIHDVLSPLTRCAGTYLPRKEVVVEETIRATIIRPNQAIRIRSRKETLDRDGTPRVTGEEWMVRKVGAYLPGAYEEVVDTVDAYVLTDKVCVSNLYLYRGIVFILLWGAFAHVVVVNIL